MSPDLLADEHVGMKVDFRGLLDQAECSLQDRAHRFLLQQLKTHLAELGARFYSGDVKVVDEFLQLYCIGCEEREAATRALVAAEAPGDSESRPQHG